MSGLPAKYARMGFARGWRAFKASRSSSKRASRAAPMAKRKRSRGISRKSSRSRGGSRGSMMSGWVPLSSSEMMVAFGTGLTVGKVNQLVAPFTDDFLSFAGQYRGEVRTALVGAVAYKFGSGLIRDAGREYFRFAVMSAGAQTANQVFGNETMLVQDQYN